MEHQVLIQDEFWNIVGGKGTYAQLLDIYAEVEEGPPGHEATGLRLLISQSKFSQFPSSRHSIRIQGVRMRSMPYSVILRWRVRRLMPRMPAACLRLPPTDASVSRMAFSSIWRIERPMGNPAASLATVVCCISVGRSSGPSIGPVGHDDHVLDAVLKLADVARPGIRDEDVHGLGGDAADVLAGSARRST